MTVSTTGFLTMVDSDGFGPKDIDTSVTGFDSLRRRPKMWLAGVSLSRILAMILEELIVLTRGTCESIIARKREARMEVQVNCMNLLLAASPEFWTSLSASDIFEDHERVLVHRYSILGLHFAAALGELTVRGETCWNRASGASDGKRASEGISASSTCIVDFSEALEFLSTEEQQDEFEVLAGQLKPKYESARASHEKAKRSLDSPATHRLSRARRAFRMTTS